MFLPSVRFPVLLELPEGAATSDSSCRSLEPDRAACPSLWEAHSREGARTDPAPRGGLGAAALPARPEARNCRRSSAPRLYVPVRSPMIPYARRPPPGDLSGVKTRLEKRDNLRKIRFSTGWGRGNTGLGCVPDGPGAREGRGHSSRGPGELLGDAAWKSKFAR